MSKCWPPAKLCTSQAGEIGGQFHSPVATDQFVFPVSQVFGGAFLTIFVLPDSEIGIRSGAAQPWIEVLYKTRVKQDELSSQNTGRCGIADCLVRNQAQQMLPHRKLE